jgi:hypothetical protein
MNEVIVDFLGGKETKILVVSEEEYENDLKSLD